MTDSDRILREHVVTLLDGRQAHVGMDSAIDKLSLDDLSRKPEGAPWTLWELFEHIRIAQSDIVEFSKSAEHQSPASPPTPSASGSARARASGRARRLPRAAR